MSDFDELKDKAAEQLFLISTKKIDETVAAIKDHRIHDAKEAVKLAVSAAAALINYPRRRDEVDDLSARVLRLSKARVLTMD